MSRLFLLFVAFVALLCAGMTPTVSQKTLDGMVKHWQHVLLLDDWQVTAIAVRLDELPEGTTGLSRAFPAYQALRIYVLDPVDYEVLAQRDNLRVKKGKEITRDIEDTVVHELLHLRLRQLRQADDAGLEAAEEVVVVRLTKALLGKR